MKNIHVTKEGLAVTMSTKSKGRLGYENLMDTQINERVDFRGASYTLKGRSYGKRFNHFHLERYNW